MRLISHYFKKISSSLNRSASEKRNRIIIRLIIIPFHCFAQSQGWEMISHLRAKLNSSIRD